MDEKRQVFTIRSLIVVFIAISAILAVIQYKSSVTFIAQLMGISWGALAGSFLAPFLYALYWKRTTKAGLLGIIPVWFRYHASESVLRLVFPQLFAVAHQLRRICHAGRADFGSSREPVHAKTGSGIGGTCLCLL